MTKKLFATGLVALLFAACAETTPPADPPAGDGPQTTLKADKGVDVAAKKIKVGTLNDESGPAAAIGKPFAVGKRVLAAQVNAGGSGLMPDGWTVELVEKDHGYNPQQAVQAYNEIAGNVLFIGTSFGTPNTLPLRPMLERDKLIAYPASLSSQMAEHANTPPAGPNYNVEAQRAMDWVVSQAADKSAIKAGIVYQQDDYGKDGLEGWKAAADHHGVTIVSEQTVAPGQKDFTAVITGLQQAGATHILMTTLPSATGPVLGTAAQMKYMPTWIGNTPSWIDRFFNPEVIPGVVLTNFYWVNGLPYWGEDVPGMDKFIAAYEAHGKDMADPDFYILVSYIQGLVALEAAKRAIDAGDITRSGYMGAVGKIDSFTAGGMIQGITLTEVPYMAGTQTRVLKPKLAEATWEVVADYAEPATMAKTKTAAAPPAAEEKKEAPAANKKAGAVEVNKGAAVKPAGELKPASSTPRTLKPAGK